MPTWGSDWRWRSVLTAAILAAVWPMSDARPADNAPRRSDAVLLLQARAALADDKVLSRFNIGVRVADGVVTLHGPTSTHDAARQAMALVERISGVRGVRNELYIPAPDDPLSRVMPRPVTTQRALTPLDPQPAPPPAPPPHPAAPAAQPVSRSLSEEIARLRDRDRRFADIRFEVNDGRVILTGTVAKARDAWEFAEIVNRLPGVLGVLHSIRDTMTHSSKGYPSRRD